MENLFEFKNEHWGDDWQEHQSELHSLECVVEEIAERHWSDDPGEPRHFDFEVEVRRAGSTESKKFHVTAQASMDFYASEVEKDTVASEPVLASERAVNSGPGEPT